MHREDEFSSRMSQSCHQCRLSQAVSSLLHPGVSLFQLNLFWVAQVRVIFCKLSV